MMKQLPRFAPLIWPKLPSLTSRHDTHHTVPRIRAELGQCFCAINDKVARVRLGFPATRVNVSPLAVNGYEIFGTGIAFGNGTITGIL